MTNLPTQPVMAKPFAQSGDKNSISVPSNASAMNLTDGFPAIFSTLISDGGKYLERRDMNAILNLISSLGYYGLVGGLVTWTSAMRDAIGGYPSGAKVWYVDGNYAYLIQSTVGNNTVTPSGSTIDVNFPSGGTTRIWWKSVTKVAMAAEKLNTARNLQIKDATGTNAGTAASFNGTANVALLLPATIKATLDGHATEDLPTAGGTMTGGITWFNTTLASPSDGVLQWGGKNVVRYVNGTAADTNGNVTVKTTMFPDYSAMNTISEFHGMTAAGTYMSTLPEDSFVVIIARQFHGHIANCYVVNGHNHNIVGSVYGSDDGTQGTISFFAKTGTVIELELVGNSTAMQAYRYKC